MKTISELIWTAENVDSNKNGIGVASTGGGNNFSIMACCGSGGGSYSCDIGRGRDPLPPYGR